MNFFDIVYSFFVYFVLVVCVLISIAFLTLFERKVLGYIQIRKGPNKVFYIGLAQPFRDAIKLFSKEQVFPYISNFILYYFSPVFSIMISLFLWIRIPFYFYFVDFDLSVIYILCVSRLGVYGIIMAGWSSNRNYALLGRLRSIAQTISYEVRLVLVLIRFLIFFFGFNVSVFFFYQHYIWFLFLIFPLSLIIYVTFLAETNRTPFDLSEGESELVSGFNVEYSRGGFAIIFLAEYGSILFMRIFIGLMVLGGNFFEFSFYIKIIFLSFSWIWVRGRFPRFRYDKLISLSWTRFLSVSLRYLLVYYNFIFILFYLL